jgi:protease-4
MATKTQGFLLGCVILLAGGALVLSAFALLLSGSGLGGGNPFEDRDKIGLVILEGPIDGSRRIVDELEAHREDEDVGAVVIRIESPGGDVASSQEIYLAVQRLAGTKPVVASVGSMAASGAYYAAVAADSIVADAGSVVGSIGVILSWPDASGLMEKAGLRLNVYKSGTMKDMGSFARPPTEEEDAVVDALIADVFEQFVDAVEEHRPLDRSRILALADGRIFTGRQAREVGLVDRVGDLHASLELAAEMAGLAPDAEVVRRNRPRVPLFDLMERFLGDRAVALWGPRLEYRLR